VTNRRLQALCQTWQERLNLREWTIDAKVVTRKLLDKGADGNAWWTQDEQKGHIYVWRGLSDEAAEATLVHELGHVLFEGHGEPADYCVHRERALNKFAAALLTGYGPNKHAAE
jgi:Zn-dependent peptidase ImmA (M78 family)